MTRFVTLTYHEIGAGQSPYIYRLAESVFENHLGVVAGPVPAHAAPLRVTFDDGHHSQFQHALPLLERFEVKAVFFVTVGWTGKHPDYMTWPQLQELVARGHRVQAHGWSHRFLTQCSPSDLEQELRRPRQELEDRLGAGVDALSCPGGRWNARVLEACRQAGYRNVYTSDPWPLERKKGDLLLIGRIGVTREMRESDLRRLAETGGRPAPADRLWHATKRLARRLVGDKAYHRLWCFLRHRNPEAGRLPGSPDPPT